MRKQIVGLGTMKGAAFSLSLTLSLAIAFAAPAAAQQTKPVAHDYKHPHAGITLPSTLGGVPLAKQQDLYDNSLDTLIEYSDENYNTVATIYIFRNTSGTVPIWFDRAQAYLETNSRYGTLSPGSDFRNFTPPGQQNASGLRVTYATPQKVQGFTSTSIMLMPVNDWYVKVRLSSKQLDAAGLDALADTILGQISLPAKIDAAPVATAIAACSDSIAFNKNAKPAKQSKDDMMMSAILGGIGEAVQDEKMKKGEKIPPPATWCRDSSSTGVLGVYRADGSKTHYLLGLGDAGRAVSHGQDELGALVKKSDKTNYSVTLIAPDRNLTYPPLSGLASPDQLYQYLEKAQPISAMGTWGDAKKTLSIGGQ